MDVPESQNSRDARIETLWKRLDPQGKGELDITGLQRGLKKIDHPLKNASDLLKDVVRAMDKNGDDVIQYEEFHAFVEQTENELLSLFKSIDQDQNGKLDKSELQAAFKKAGLSVPAKKLNQFFAEVDGNHDGYISFEEWRNFLLFLPTNTENPPLKAVLSYYSSTFALNSEGDTSIRDDTLEGLGTTSQMFLNILFGAIIKIADPPRIRSSPPMGSSTAFSPFSTTSLDGLNETSEASRPYLPEGAFSTKASTHLQTSLSATLESEEDQQELDQEQAQISEDVASPEKSLLTSLLPDPGYFAAGAIAGVISRTATAPLDRLKVYLIAKTSPIAGSIDGAKSGNVGEATRKFGRPLILACKDLWAGGGLRNLYAGNGVNVAKVMPESAIRFGSYEGAKRIFARLEGRSDPKDISGTSKFLAGGCGGLVSQLVVYPVDTLKFRMQCESVAGGPHGNALIYEVARKTYKQGYRTFYRGLTMGLVGMFPYSAIDLWTFEWLKSSVTPRIKMKMGYRPEECAPGQLATGAIGAFSGAFGASVVYPLNLLRTRLQAQGTILHPPNYTGFRDVFQRTVKNEGVRGLFKGITPNLIKVAPAVGVTYMVYEQVKTVLDLP